MLHVHRQQRRQKKDFRNYDLNQYYLPQFYRLFKRQYMPADHNKQKVNFFTEVF
jgi:hypothetical protein